MIELHRLNGTTLFINHRLIEVMEASPDTVLTLTTERRFVVKEKPDEIQQKIQDFEKKIFEKALYPPADSEISS